MIAPTSEKPPFWQVQNSQSGCCDERLLMQVWHLDPGPQQDHWSLYAAYPQEQLRHEVVSNWQAWGRSRPVVSYVPWVWALKVYLWRFPLDTQFFEELRHEMGPFWLMHVRHSEEDWTWLYAMRNRTPMNALALVLSLLPAHPVGQALVVDIPPIFEGYSADEINNKSRVNCVLSQTALGLLHNYGDVLLHPQAHFYPRWRALLICLGNSIRDARKGKKKAVNPFVQEALDRSCDWLELTPRTLWKGFDSSWVDFAKEKDCTSLDSWDIYVATFSSSKDWRERLRQGVTPKQPALTVLA